MRDAVILTTHKCTLACPDCNGRIGDPKNWVGMLYWENFTAFVGPARSKPYYDRMFFHGGEPTLWPYLKQAISWAKTCGVSKKVIVVSNGRGQTIEDYGDADAIQISDYGAVNRLDQYRLKSADPRRVTISHPVHVPVPTSDVPGVIPADCLCLGDTLAQDKVFPCYTAAHIGDVTPVTVDAGWDNETGLPAWHDTWDNSRFKFNCCRRCLANRRIMEKIRPPVVAESFPWNSTYGCMFRLPWKAKWARNLWRKIAGRPL